MCGPAPIPAPMPRLAIKSREYRRLRWEDVGDFWNDPRRWDGISDPHKQMFWSVDRGPVQNLSPFMRDLIERVDAALAPPLDSTPA